MIYGPLELVDGRWVLGDAQRPGGRWVGFEPDGLVHHAEGTQGELIPWSRIMPGVGLQIGHGTKGSGYWGDVGLTGLLGGLPGPFQGRGGGHLSMTLRHPYEYRKLTFDRHPTWYRTAHVLLLAELLTHAVSEGDAHRLGDAEWLTWAVGRLETVGSWPLGHQPADVLQKSLSG
ncbi:hypothetical protein ACIA8O_36380 [Kitasatospora sp. NPDC051853]|uniref:hypothetical protein n=1 Tax=Kitasatospora sp. NPDC051853 TaxID=3364058 RepID=UPI003789FCDD